MNDKLESGNNNLICLFTELDWKEWEEREERGERKKRDKLTPEMIKFIRKTRYNRKWKYGCNRCICRSNFVRGIKQHYKYAHNIEISGEEIRSDCRIMGLLH